MSNLHKYYEDRFAMFSLQGWKDFLEDVSNLKEPLENIRIIQSEQTLHFRKGQLDILDWILTTPEMSEKAYQELLEEGE